MTANPSPVTIRLATFVVAACLPAINGTAAPTASGPVTIVEADPHHKGTVLAGTSAAVLFRSRDWTDSWTRLRFPAELKSTLHAILIDPSRANVYFVAVTSENPEYAGLFRSTDDGASWEQLPDLRRKQVWSLACWPTDAKVIAAGTQDGVYLTRDGGESWTRISSPEAGPQPVVALAFDPAHANILYAGTPHLSWKTVDSGANWHSLGRGMQEDSDIFSIEVDGTRPRRLFAGACSGIYRSLDAGNSWASLEQAVGAQFRTYVVTHRPRSANTLLAGTNAGLLQSVDGGATWRRVSLLSTRSIAFDISDPRRVVIATDQGVLRSADAGRHFTLANQDDLTISSALAADQSETRSAQSSAADGVHEKR